MNEMDRKWTDRLRSRMLDYEEAGPEGLWQAISDDLDKNKVIPVRIVPGTGKKKFGRYIAGALSAAAAIALAVYFSLDRGPHRPADDADRLAVINDTTGMAVPDQEVTEYAVINDVSGTGLPKAGNLIAMNTVSRQTPDKSSFDSVSSGGEPDKGQPIPEQNQSPGRENTEKEDSRRSDRYTGEDRHADDRFEWKDYPDTDRPAARRERGTFHASISASNLTGSISSFSGYSGLSSASVLSADKVKEEIVSTRAAAVQERSGTYGTPYSTEVSHRQPVRVGVSLRYDITKRWGVETGLTYSLLSSTTSTGGEGYSSRAEQELHYLGIPVHLSYDFLQLKWFSMYLKAGGMVEKCISGKTVTTYIPEGEGAFESREDIMVRPLQWSLNAAIGAEVHFTPHIGLYIEPGVSYFFNDGSSVATIYKEKPVNFNFEFGLRFTFR